LEETCGILDSCADAIAALSGHATLSPDQMRLLAGLLKDFVIDAQSRQNERDAERANPEFDEDDAGDLEEDEETDQELLANVHSVVAQLCKVGGAAFFATFDVELMPLCRLMMQRERSIHSRIIGVCLVDECLSYCGGAAAAYVAEFFPIALEYSRDADPGLRQAAACGIGVCAQITPPGGAAFAAVCEPAMSQLLTVINAPDAREEDNACATDDAISAVGKVLMFQTPCLPAQGDGSAAALTSRWLTWLPLRDNEDEAKEIHGALARFATSPRQMELLGADNVNLPRLLAVFTAIHGDDDVCTAETSAAIAQFVHAMVCAVPAQAMQLLAASLPTDDARAKLSAIAASS
jgi:hypothetical protein